MGLRVVRGCITLIPLLSRGVVSGHWAVGPGVDSRGLEPDATPV